MNSLIKSAFLTLSLILAKAAMAAGPVTVTPSTANVNAGGSSVITVRWRVGVTASVPTSITVTSPAAVLSLGGTLGAPLTQTVQHPGTGLIFVTFPERVRIDRTTAKRIGQAGTATLGRIFTDINGASALTTVALRGTGSGDLAYRNFELRFDDDTGFRVVQEGTSLTARLSVTTNGHGVLDGAWEIAGPSSSQGLGFRPISRVRQVLSGSRKTVFESPPLPTAGPGIYRVRFVPGSGVTRAAGETYPDLTYTVVREAKDRAATVDLIGPIAGAGVTAATRFEWRRVSGAAQYRLEFLRAEGGGVRADRVAALDVQSNSTQLRSFTLGKLGSQRDLFWRVTAFDGEGVPIAVSPARKVTGGAAANRQSP